MVNWVVEDQAVVLFARFTPGGSFGLDEGTGVILNWDLAQDGDTAGDRNGGQLQINTIAPGFAADHQGGMRDDADTRALLSLCASRALDQVYTGHMYDLQDLTTPVVTLQFTDPIRPTPRANVVSFPLAVMVPGTTDITIDNYYAGATDPESSHASCPDASDSRHAHRGDPHARRAVAELL